MLGRLIGTILVGGAVLGSALLATTFASAQEYDPNYPVCMKVMEYGGGLHVDCSFTSIPQCNATASGRAAQCVVNPFYGYDRNGPPMSGYRR